MEEIVRARAPSIGEISSSADLPGDGGEVGIRSVLPDGIVAIDAIDSDSAAGVIKVVVGDQSSVGNGRDGDRQAEQLGVGRGISIVVHSFFEGAVRGF